MIKSIIKRVLVIVLSSIALAFISKYLLITNVFALEMSSSNTGSLSAIISNQDAEVQHLVSGSPWNSWGPGYLYFDFAISKTDGTSTSSLVLPRGATACSGNTCYICSIGSTDSNNSTYVGAVYSARCPMTMSANGLTKVAVQFLPLSQSTPSTYQFSMGGLKTFEQALSSQVNIDVSSINQQTQQQMNNDNNNTNRIISSQNSINNSINDINDSINNDNVDDSVGTTESWFNNFEVEQHGLSTFVTSPFRLIQAFTTESCNPLSFQLPFVHNQVTIPCFRPIIQEHFGVFFTLFQLITTGLIAYRVSINVFAKVHQMSNPYDDRIEVFNL